jgi:ribonuclease E
VVALLAAGAWYFGGDHNPGQAPLTDVARDGAVPSVPPASSEEARAPAVAAEPAAPPTEAEPPASPTGDEPPRLAAETPPAPATPPEPPAETPAETPAERPRRPAPAVAATAAEPAAVQAFQLPTDEFQAVAEAAGLQWVNSDADKIRAVQEAIASEPPPMPAPREIKPVEAVDEGPLVLVETRKDLSEFKLPFEASQASQQTRP